MEILYKGIFNSTEYYKFINIYEEQVVIQTVYPVKPKNIIHSYKNISFSEEDEIKIIKDNNGVINIEVCNTS